jgi:U4/U6.U5 tri-snRNP-associated protein 2
VTTLSRKLVSNFEEQQRLEKLERSGENETESNGWEETTQEVPFTYLSLDIPPIPLFRDSEGSQTIPQLPLFQIFSKFDGNQWTDQVTKEAHYRKRYRIRKLPRYLILHLARFTKNNFSLEKNPTVVTFPVRNLELKDYLFENSGLDENSGPLPTASQIKNLSPQELRDFILKFGSKLQQLELSTISLEGASDFIEELRLIAEAVLDRASLFNSTKYDLIASICHEGRGQANGIDVGNASRNAANMKKSSADRDDVFSKGTYKIHLQNKSSKQWYELEDLLISETTAQHIGKCC